MAESWYRKLILGWRSAAAAAALFLVSIGATPAFAEPGAATPGAAINAFYGVLVEAMKGGTSLGQTGRYNLLEPAVSQWFNIPKMTQLAVGPGWQGLSQQEQRDLTAAFRRYITSTYTQNFNSFSGQRFVVLGQRVTPYGTIVDSQIIPSSGEPVAIDYLMRENGGTWQIVDIYLQGTISQLADLRSQFTAVLNDQGPQALIARLNRTTGSALSVGAG